eukprot:TRINITY_DN45369_c0_g1_i1.p1 TRINITY_DN45369_c0_g1~~TRINITY_DN45369_c0_g1_i1.p1  ORF type:complete len:401 (+),score=43.32 TRINITY_DN45369_c0_g1_i1:109-1203(+)
MAVAAAVPWGYPCVSDWMCEGNGVKCRERWAPNVLHNCMHEWGTISDGGDCKLSEECASENCSSGKCNPTGAPPISDGAVYDQAEALTYLYYTKASWCDATSLKTWSCGEPCEKTQIVSGSVHAFGPGAKGGVKGYVAEQKPGQCIVAFRGSCNLENVYKDISTSKAAWESSWCPGCKVHKGFLDAFLELRDDMLVGLKNIGCQTVSVTGHSLGAAVGALAAMELRGEQQLHVEPVYLSGCPRVGTQSFVNAFIQLSKAQNVVPPAWRVVRNLDPVPRIPTEWMGFRHFPQEVYYNEDCSSFRVCDLQHGDDDTCSSGTSFFHAHSPLDHTTYLNVSLEVKQMPKECIANPSILPMCNTDAQYV